MSFVIGKLGKPKALLCALALLVILLVPFALAQAGSLMITKDPVNAVVHIGKNATFSVETNDSDAQYQWQCKESASEQQESASDDAEEDGWENVDGEVKNELTVAVTEDNIDTLYRCQIVYSDSTKDAPHQETTNEVSAIKASITAQPKYVTVKSGGSADFVVATNDPDAIYQWETSGDNGQTWMDYGASGGKTNARCTVSSSAEKGSYLYRCRITFKDGETETSDYAALNLIVTQPENAVANPGETATFSVVTTYGSQVESYQWMVSEKKSGGKALAGQSEPELAVVVDDSNVDKYFACKVTFKDGGTLTSDWAKIDAITRQPVSTAYDEEAVFDTEANDAKADYHWQRSVDGGDTWQELDFEDPDDARGPELVVNLEPDRMGDVYRCVVTFSDDNVAYTDTVGIESGITTQPRNVAAKAGDTVSFSVGVNAGADATYQWESSTDKGATWNDSADEGYATDTLTVAVTSENLHTWYRCKVTIDDEEFWSSCAYVTGVITKQPSDSMTEEGETAQFSVEVSDTVKSYLWQYSKDGKSPWSHDLDSLNIGAQGKSTGTLSVTSSQESAALYYRCIVTFEDGTSVTSDTVRVTSPVCAIGDAKYGSVASAMDSAKDGDTIKLVKSAVSEDVVGGSHSVTLDLNGCQLLGGITADAGELTVTSSQAWGRNTKDGKDIPQVTGRVQGASLVIEGGTYNALIVIEQNLSSATIATGRHSILVKSSFTKDEVSKDVYTNTYKSFGAASFEDENRQYAGCAFQILVVEPHSLEQKTTTCCNISYWYCSGCNASFSDEQGAEPLDVTAYARHSMKAIEAKDATCTSEGNNAYYTCVRCGLSFKDDNGTQPTTPEEEKLAVSHSKQYIAPKAPTCEAEGTSGYWWCYVCGAVYEDEDFTQPTSKEAKSIPALGHLWSTTGEITKEPTCTSTGERTFVCERDSSHTHVETVEKLEHDLELIPAVQPTCTTEGHNAYYQCRICGGYFTEDGESTTPEDQVIPIKHTVVHFEAQEATCTTPGHGDYYEYTCCKRYFVEDASGHLEATTSAVAEATPALGHTLVHHDAVAATCTEWGNTEYYQCSRCELYFSDAEGANEIKSAQINISALGHQLTLVPATSPTTTSVGNYNYYTCDRCGAIFDSTGENETTLSEMTIPMLSVSGDDSTGGTTTTGSASPMYNAASSASSAAGQSTTSSQSGADVDATIGYEGADDVVEDQENATDEAETAAQNQDNVFFDSEGNAQWTLFAFIALVLAMIAAGVVATLLVRNGVALGRKGAGTGKYAPSHSAQLAAQQRELKGKDASSKPLPFSYVS